MRILLDECLPFELAAELVGHDVRTVQQEGWAGVENGELLHLAAGSLQHLNAVGSSAGLESLVLLPAAPRVLHVERFPEAR